MDWLARLRQWWQGSATRAAIVMTTGTGPRWTPRAYDELVREGYLRSSTVYTCVRTIARAIGGLVWLLQREEAGAWREIHQHPLLTLLARPTPDQAGPQWLEALVTHLLIGGNTYVELVGPTDQNGRLVPRELHVLRPDRVRVVTGTPAQPIAGYTYQVGAQQVSLPADRVIHLKLHHPLDDWYGLSPIEVLARAIDADVQALAWQVSLLTRGARPSGALVTQERLTTEQLDRLRQTVATEWAGSARAGAPLVLGGGLEWREMGLSPRELDWRASRRVTQLEIASAFGVPAELIGLKEATYENRHEARKAFYVSTVLPLADYLVAEFNAALVPRFGPGLRLLYDRDAIEALQEDRSFLWQRVAQAPWLTINEQRLATGYDELPEGDVLLLPASATPWSPTSAPGDSPSFEALAAREAALSAPGPRGHKAADARDRRWQPHWRRLVGLERTYTPAIRGWLDQQRQRLLEHARTWLASLADTEPEPDALARGLTLWLDWDAEHQRLVEVSRRPLRRALAQGAEAAWTELRLRGEFSDLPAAHELLDVQLRQLAGIAESVRASLAHALAEGLRENESPRELADRLRETYTGLRETRALTIARTESARAYNTARQAVWHAEGVRATEWLSARDERVRREPYNHAIDGERVPLGARFSNGLRFPGDPEGAAGNVINCRCVTIPVDES